MCQVGESSAGSEFSNVRDVLPRWWDLHQGLITGIFLFAEEQLELSSKV